MSKKNCGRPERRSRPGTRLWVAGALTLLSLLALTEGSSLAYFEDLGVGVRPIGMGEAFVAVADDSNAVLWNPAGLADLTMRELNTAYSSLYTNLRARLYTGESDSLAYGNIGLALPFEPQIGSFGLFWTQFNSRFYNENTFTLSYAREVGSAFYQLFKVNTPPAGVIINAGINLKVMNWGVTSNEFTAANPLLGGGNLSRSGFTGGLGLLAATPEHLKFGVSLENIIPNDVGVTVSEGVPFNLRLGMSYRYDLSGPDVSVDSVLGAMEFTYRESTADIRVGSEAWFLKHMLAGRLGTTADAFTAGASFYTPLNYADMAMRLDYAFTYPYGIVDTFGSHRVSVILNWGSIKGEPKPAVEPEPALVVEPDQNLAEQRDRELGIERAREEARLKELNAKLSAQVTAAREELAKLQELIKLGKIPSIQFESGKAILTEASFKTLNEVGRVIEKYPQIKTRLEGHTDSIGKAAGNQRLSQLRVEAVKAYLQGRFRITPTNLITVGYGQTRPLASNATAEGRSANRRVEFKVLIPAGLVSAATGIPTTAGQLDGEGQVGAEDVVRYEDLENLRDKLKVYEMQMNPKEVEQMFNEQHKQSDVTTGDTPPTAQPNAQPTPGGETK